MLLRMKQGATFSFTGQYLEDDGVTPRPLTGVTLSSQIRHKKSLVDTLVVTVLDSAAGTYSMVASADTTNWPIGVSVWDIRETIGGVVRITETHELEVMEAVTLL